jgi:Zn-finger nucleic acid-binding protein
MLKQIVKGVVTDKCPKCGGVWLDPGELDLIKRAIQDASAGDFATGFVIGMSAGQGE